MSKEVILIKIKNVIIILVSIALLLSGCSSSASNSAEIPPIHVSETPEIASSNIQPNTDDSKTESVNTYYNNYAVSLDIDPLNKTVTGIEKILYKNTSKQSLPDLYLNIYANAFSKDTTSVPYPEEYKDAVFNYGVNYSSFNIISLSVNNTPVNYLFSDTTLQIMLTQPLKPGEEIEITLQFESQIPTIAHRLGSNSTSMWFGNFIPSMAVYDSENWKVYPYYAYGEPFYSDISNYEVTITTPNGYKVASTGSAVVSEQTDKTVTTVSAKVVRDFAFSISNQYIKDSITTEDGTTINLYHTSNKADNINQFLSTAKSSMEFYVDNVGSYPYQKLDIVECNLYYKGDMEYPQFIMVDKSYLNTQTEINALTFDFGLQWFNNIIGTNGVTDGWLNNGITGFLQNYIHYTPQLLNSQMNGEYLELKEILKNTESPSLDNPLPVYQSWDIYNNVSCKRSTLMIYSLYKKIGTDNFMQLLKTYYTQYSFKNAKPEDFFEIAEEIYGHDLSNFFDSWINDVKMPNL